MMAKPYQIVSLFIGLFLILLINNKSYATDAVFDMHMHYKWSQKEVTSPEDAIRYMDEQNIVHAVVIGKPPALALALKNQAPDRITAIYSPYRDSQDWYRWQRNKKLIGEATRALKSGQYKGIGELHIIGGGFAGKLGPSSVLHALLKLAQEYDVPIMLHTEFSKPDYMLAICEKYPKTKILWAHAGAILKPVHVDLVMSRCPNVWSGMAARDRWRYVSNQHTDKNGVLLPEWKALLLKYPNRFMVGSDTVWPVEQLDSWDEPDTGWQQLGKFWGFHRSWLSQLPKEVADKIKRENALGLFDIKVKQP